MTVEELLKKRQETGGVLVVKSEDFSNTDFSNTRLRDIKFIDCKFNNANFENAFLWACDFQNCTLQRCNFVKADIAASKFSICNLDNTDFTRASIEDRGVIDGQHFENCSFKSACFYNTELAGLKFNSNNFQDANFWCASLICTDISNSNFQNANLELVNCYSAIISNSNLENATLPDYNNPKLKLVANNPKVEICNDIQRHKFKSAYSKILAYDNESLKGLNFMKEVVKEHGTNTNNLLDAINVVTECEKETPIFMAQLLQATLKTDEYKKAFEKEQGQSKTAENAK